MSGSHSSYVKTVLVWVAATALTVFAASSKPPVDRPDAEIVRVFKEKLAKSKLAPNGFQIQVKNGVATLTGHTDIVQHKGTATRMAKSAGAREVRNQIEVSAAARRKIGDRFLHARQKRAEEPKPVQSNAGTPKATASEAPPPPVRRAQIKRQ